jgi:hypothetical protein
MSSKDRCVLQNAEVGRGEARLRLAPTNFKLLRLFEKSRSHIPSQCLHVTEKSSSKSRRDLVQNRTHIFGQYK